ncbi:hypothetical protein [Trichormus azollae]|uniref:hypothetical protein n=1 Tax=Trichormus azollae TaxID=1164 RepID=UPI0001958CD2|nr:hypothetical protein [Trichormus azollae]
MLLAHEDKTYPDALIASMTIPWDEVKDEQDEGGYHLLWMQDIVSSVAGLVAARETYTALRSPLVLCSAQPLIYLATSQQYIQH